MQDLIKQSHGLECRMDEGGLHLRVMQPES